MTEVLKHERRVETGLGVVVVQIRPHVHFRRVVSSDEIAKVTGLPVGEISRVGRLRKRLYFDAVDRQFKASYTGHGNWRIHHRTRYW